MKYLLGICAPSLIIQYLINREKNIDENINHSDTLRYGTFNH